MGTFGVIDLITIDLQFRILRAKLAYDTGWTLEYIDGLNLVDYGDMIAYKEGVAKLERID